MITRHLRKIRRTLKYLLFCGAALFVNHCTLAQTVIDINGNVYQVVQIGKQLWMAENLRTVCYNNGDTIPLVAENKSWSKLATGARCSYNNNTENIKKHGMYYNWYAVNDLRGLCPKGWHIPTDAEWQLLVDFLGGEKTAGGKLKSAWDSDEIESGSTGFNANPGGYRIYAGKYMYMGDYAGFWSSTNGNNDFAWIHFLRKYDAAMERIFFGKKNGINCRCVKTITP